MTTMVKRIAQRYLKATWSPADLAILAVLKEAAISSKAPFSNRQFQDDVFDRIIESQDRLEQLVFAAASFKILAIDTEAGSYTETSSITREVTLGETNSGRGPEWDESREVEVEVDVTMTAPEEVSGKIEVRLPLTRVCQTIESVLKPLVVINPLALAKGLQQSPKTGQAFALLFGRTIEECEIAKAEGWSNGLLGNDSVEPEFKPVVGAYVGETEENVTLSYPEVPLGSVLSGEVQGQALILEMDFSASIEYSFIPDPSSFEIENDDMIEMAEEQEWENRRRRTRRRR